MTVSLAKPTKDTYTGKPCAVELPVFLKRPTTAIESSASSGKELRTASTATRSRYAAVVL